MTLHENWRDRAPSSLQSMDGPDGKPCATPLDRRWLWRLESFLAVYGTNDTQHSICRDLREYLNQTCDHAWSDYAGDDAIPAHRQCLWCNDVEWFA